MKQITSAQLLDDPILENVYKTVLPDGVYNLPTTKWLQSVFLPFYVGVLKEIGVYEWHDRFDCDDFACLFRALAQISHRKSNGTGDGLTVAEIHYVAAGTNGVYGPHAINMALTEKGWVFIEPQNGSMKTLTDTEKKSIFYAYI